MAPKHDNKGNEERVFYLQGTYNFIDTQIDGRVIRTEIPPWDRRGNLRDYDSHYWEDVTDTHNAFNKGK